MFFHHLGEATMRGLDPSDQGASSDGEVFAPTGAGGVGTNTLPISRETMWSVVFSITNPGNSIDIAPLAGMEKGQRRPAILRAGNR